MSCNFSQNIQYLYSVEPTVSKIHYLISQGQKMQQRIIMHRFLQFIIHNSELFPGHSSLVISNRASGNLSPDVISTGAAGGVERSITFSYYDGYTIFQSSPGPRCHPDRKWRDLPRIQSETTYMKLIQRRTRHVIPTRL